jgi:hypothetical protein
VKASAFIFQTPSQRAAWAKAMEHFAEETGCGLEALALRRNSNRRRLGSVADIAAEIYRLVRAGEMTPSQLFNLSRSSDPLDHLRKTRPDEIRSRKAEALNELLLEVDAAGLTEAASLTGLFVVPGDFGRLTPQ